MEALAAAKRATAGQIALAWVLAQGGDIHAIPGTTKLRNLESNLAAADVTLTAADRAQLEALASRVQGARYPPARMAMVQQ